MNVLTIVLLCSVATGAAFVVARFFFFVFKKDTEVENRRRGAAKLAATLYGLGLEKLPEFLIDYSVGDYSGMAKKIVDTAKLFLEGEGAVLTEFSAVFDNLLAAKLKTEEGRAYIAAKLTDATKAGDASIVTDAPKATVI
jgi:hypothetical protein